MSGAKTTKTTKPMNLLTAFEGTCVMEGLRITRDVKQYTEMTNDALVGLLGWGKLDRELKPKIQALIPILEAGRDAHVLYTDRVLSMCSIADSDVLRAACDAFDQEPAVVQHNEHYGKKLMLVTPAELEGLPNYTGSETLRAQVADAFIVKLNEALSHTTNNVLSKISKVVKNLHKAIGLLPEELQVQAHAILGTYASAWCNEMMAVPLLRDDQKVTAEKSKMLWGACQQYLADGASPEEALSRSMMRYSIEALITDAPGSLKAMLALLDDVVKPGNEMASPSRLKAALDLLGDMMKPDHGVAAPVVVDAPPLRFVEKTNPV